MSSTFFHKKNIRILYIESAKTVNEKTLIELVKLTTLWTTGPCSLCSCLIVFGCLSICVCVCGGGGGGGGGGFSACSAWGFSTWFVKHLGETHIIKNTVMKQSERLDGDLKSGHKKIANRTTMSRDTDIDSQGRPSVTYWRASRHLVWGLTHRRAINGSKGIDHVCTLPQNICNLFFFFFWTIFLSCMEN